MSAWERLEPFDAALSAILFFSVVVLAMLACRQPARRILIARVALLASLAIIPLSSLDLFPRLDVVDVILSADLVPRSLFKSSSPIEPTHTPNAPLSSAPVPDRTRSNWRSSPTNGNWHLLAHVLVVLVLAGMGAGFAWLLLGFGGVQWLIRRSRAPSTATQVLYEPIVAAGSNVAKRSVLRVSTRVRRPVVVGLFRSTILIPESLDLPAGNPEFLRLSLLHELAHVERYDHWFNTVANLAQTVWFFLPQSWWLRSQLMIDQEFLADQSAARRYGASSDYAASLLSMAADPSAQDVAAVGSLAPTVPTREKAGVPSALFQRMLMLLYCPFRIETRTPRLWFWTAMLAVLGASVVAVCLVVRWPKAETIATTSHQFRVAHFIAEPLPGPRNGRSIAYSMPLPLPPSFDLDVEVRSNPDDLGHIRIAGYPLTNGVPSQTGRSPRSAPGFPPTKTWRKVHVHRDHQSVTVKVDGQPLSNEHLSETTSDVLTIEPGTQGAAEFRNLIVSW